MCEAALAWEQRTWPIAGVSFTPRIAASLTLPALLGCLAACGAQAGGQTGEESGDGCVFITSPLAERERSPLGFSSEQVLAMVDAERSASFEWSRGSGLEYGPESGAAEVTVRIARTGAAHFARVDPDESAPHCRDHVRIPVTVDLATGGGAFDESLQATLLAESGDEASVTHVVPSAALRGAFAFAPGALGTRRFQRLEVNLRFRAEAFAGQLFAGVESGDEGGGSVSFQPVPLACWGESPSLPPCSK